ncbi:unnamed protein product [Amoebophrya sp. A120]|nr:unnamed protein product [Amoebophrya sp. A120]|eukprot:GSA120T00018792001.1
MASSSSYVPAQAKYVKVPTLHRNKKYHPRPIGYRGNHDHGKDLDDPVYPTKVIPHELRPKHSTDWRNAGRALLTASLAMIEGQRMKHLGMFKKWQEKGYCGERCLAQCACNADRFFCANRVKGSFFDFVNATDGILLRYRGEIAPQDFANKKGKKPVYTVPRPVATQNERKSKVYFVHNIGTTSFIEESGATSAVSDLDPVTQQGVYTDGQDHDREQCEGAAAFGSGSSQDRVTYHGRHQVDQLEISGAKNNRSQVILRAEKTEFVHPAFQLGPDLEDLRQTGEKVSSERFLGSRSQNMNSIISTLQHVDGEEGRNIRDETSLSTTSGSGRAAAGSLDGFSDDVLEEDEADAELALLQFEAQREDDEQGDDDEDVDALEGDDFAEDEGRDQENEQG